jgi:hypothetical protein
LTFTHEEQERLRRWDKHTQRLRNSMRRVKPRPEGRPPKTPRARMDWCCEIFYRLRDALSRADKRWHRNRTSAHVLKELIPTLPSKQPEPRVESLRHLLVTALKSRRNDDARASWVVWQLEIRREGVSLDRFRRTLYERRPRKSAPAT